MRQVLKVSIAFICSLLAGAAANGQSTASLCAPLSPLQSVSNEYSWTQQQLFDALTQANVELESWFTTRSRGLSGSVIFGPALDATYFYRLGEQDDWDRDSLGNRLDQYRRDFLAMGFPKPEPSELALIGLTNNRARAIGAPFIVRCAKHFPGGDENLERSEALPVTYSDPSQIETLMIPFRELVNGKNPPFCMMLGHAQYVARPFDGAAKVNLGPLIGEQSFSDIPASLNPEIVRYLRNQLGFAGITIADWLNMGAVLKFVEKLPGKHSPDLLMLYVGTYAGVDYLPGIHFAKIGDIAQQAHALPPKIFKDWDQKLSDWMFDFAGRMKMEATTAQIAKMSFEAKIAIKTSSSRGDTDRDLIAQFLSREDTNKVLMWNTAGDPWNRSGILVLLQRQLALEILLRNSGVVAHDFDLGWPNQVSDELGWFNRLKSDSIFSKAYGSVDWGSVEVQNMFCLIRRTRF